MAKERPCSRKQWKCNAKHDVARTAPADDWKGL